MAQQVKACHYCDLGLIPTLGTFACHRYGGKGKREGGNRKGEKGREGKTIYLDYLLCSRHMTVS